MRMKACLEECLTGDFVTETEIWFYGPSAFHSSEIILSVQCNVRMHVCLNTCAFTCLPMDPNAWLSLCQWDSLFDQHLAQLQRLQDLSSLSCLFSSLWCHFYFCPKATSVLYFP